MQEFDVDVKTRDGAMGCFAALPDGGGPFPAIIIYMDAPGIREELRSFARRVAGEGYFCLLPDMYYRQGEVRFDRSKIGDAMLKEILATMATLDHPKVVDDTAGMIDYLDTHDAVRSPYGCIGYCMSGQYVISAAGNFPDHFAATASLYGVGIVTDAQDSPHLLAPNIKGELYLGFAETDNWVPDNVIPTLRSALDGNEVTYQLDIYPSTHHGFCFPERPHYHEQSAEKVWTKVFEMYRRRLTA